MILVGCWLKSRCPRLHAESKRVGNGRELFARLPILTLLASNDDGAGCSVRWLATKKRTEAEKSSAAVGTCLAHGG
jgi:hypothetical protein